MPDKYEDMCDKALAGEQQDNRESNMKEKIKELTEEMTKPIRQQDNRESNMKMLDLTFNQFQIINQHRCEQGFYHPVSKWDINDWATATGGEIGEAIQELGKLLTFLDTAKKIKRLEDHPYNDEELVRLLDQFAEEIADIITYCDLTMTRIRRNTQAELIKKFNKVSDKRGCAIKL